MSGERGQHLRRAMHDVHRLLAPGDGEHLAGFDLAQIDLDRGHRRRAHASDGFHDAMNGTAAKGIRRARRWPWWQKSGSRADPDRPRRWRGAAMSLIQEFRGLLLFFAPGPLRGETFTARTARHYTLTPTVPMARAHAKHQLASEFTLYCGIRAHRSGPGTPAHVVVGRNLFAGNRRNPSRRMSLTRKHSRRRPARRHLPLARSVPEPQRPPTRSPRMWISLSRTRSRPALLPLSGIYTQRVDAVPASPVEQLFGGPVRQRTSAA